MSMVLKIDKYINSIMKLTNKHLYPTLLAGFDWMLEPLDYEEVIYKPLPAPKTAKSKTPIKDAISNLWNRLTNLSGQTMLANPSGYPMYAGALKFNTTIGNELKVAGAGAASIGVPAVLNYAYNYPVTVATDLLYGYGGTKLGGKVGNELGKPIDYLTGNHYASEGFGYLGNLVGGGLALNAANNFRKRAIETVMRSGNYEIPDFYDMWEVFKQMPGKRKFDIFKYIFTGNKTGPKGYYNSFASEHWGDATKYDYYAGLLRNGSILGNDIIDAYLYGKPLDPKFATKLPKDSPNPYVDYIARNYPDKDIPMYQLNPNFDMGYTGAKSVNNPSNWQGAIGHSGTNPFNFLKNGLDVGGHLEQQGLTETGAKAIRGADIWKFNPKDYMLTWLKDLDTWEVPYYLKIGLNEVNKAGTPVITTTPWIREVNEQEWNELTPIVTPETPY